MFQMHYRWNSVPIQLVRVFSDVLVAFLYFDICHYSGKYQNMEKPITSEKARITIQYNYAIENSVVFYQSTYINKLTAYLKH